MSTESNRDSGLTDSTGAIGTDPRFIGELRSQMLKFAKLQLRDETLAEDAVQEALIGALKGARSFAHQSAIKTWVFAILKNKIADQLRKSSRLVTATGLVDDPQDSSNLNTLFDSNGFWQKDERPVAWSQPLEAIKNSQFWRVFESCLQCLPDHQARLFMMREFLEFDSTEICQTLNISTSNLHVMLYRARMRLRECLENHWFAPGE